MNQHNSLKQEAESRYQIVNGNECSILKKDKDEKLLESKIIEQQPTSLIQTDIGMNNNLEEINLESSSKSIQEQTAFEDSNPHSSTKIGQNDNQTQLLTQKIKINQQSQLDSNENLIINNIPPMNVPSSSGLCQFSTKTSSNTNMNQTSISSVAANSISNISGSQNDQSRNNSVDNQQQLTMNNSLDDEASTTREKNRLGRQSGKDLRNQENNTLISSLPKQEQSSLNNARLIDSSYINTNINLVINNIPPSYISSTNKLEQVEIQSEANTNINQCSIKVKPKTWNLNVLRTQKSSERINSIAEYQENELMNSECEECKKKQNLINEQDHKIKQLEQYIEMMKDDKLRETQLIKDKDKEIEQLKKQHDAYQNQIDEKDNQIKLQDATLKDLEKDNQEQETKLKDKDKVISELRKKMNENEEHSSDYVKIILNIINVIQEKGINNNNFFDVFQQSGIITQIEQLIQLKIQFEEKDNDNAYFSEIIQQLMKLYLTVMKEQQIKEYQKKIIKRIMDKSDSNILGSNLLSEQEKETKAINLFEQMKNKDINELLNIFEIKQLIVIKFRIGDCCSESEKILLNIIEVLSEKGQQEHENNQFFSIFQQSGIINKVEQLVEDKIEKENQQKKYSEEFEQLTRIYIKIMNERESDKVMIDIYIKVIDKNINNLVNIINNLKENENKGSKNKLDNEEIKRQLKQSAKLIRVISLIKEKDPNCGTRIPDQIIKIIKEKVSPLIHINCPEQINCSQCIIIQASPSLQELREAAFQALVEASYHYNEIKSMLNQDYNFLTHLAQFIISYSTQFQLELKTNINQQQHQQQSKYSSSPSFISSSLYFFQDQIYWNKNHKQIIKIPNFLRSLTILINYNRNMHINNEQEQQSFCIRQNSRWCLNSIQEHGDEQDQSKLINVGYGNALIIQFSTAGGTQEQKDKEIYQGLQNIHWFHNKLDNYNNNYRNKNKKYNNNNNKSSFPSQPALSKIYIEQIEEEGGNEEVESQLINKGFNNNNIKNQANQTKANFLNFFIDRSNTKRW